MGVFDKTGIHEELFQTSIKILPVNVLSGH